MATDTTEPDAPFTIRSLIGQAGVGSNGEKLVSAIQHFYPPELEAAQLGRPNAALSADLDRADVAKVVGDGVEVRDAVVRGGELDPGDAWVTYAGYDETGDTVKGAFPYTDLGKSSSDRHVSQIDRLQESDAARDFRTSQEKAATAASEAPGAAAGPVDPIAQYEDMRWQDVVAYVEAHPERAAVVEALETATRPGDERKTVLAAVRDAKGEGGGGQGGDGSGDGSGDQGASGDGGSGQEPASGGQSGGASGS